MLTHCSSSQRKSNLAHETGLSVTAGSCHNVRLPGPNPQPQQVFFGGEKKGKQRVPQAGAELKPISKPSGPFPVPQPHPPSSAPALLQPLGHCWDGGWWVLKTTLRAGLEPQASLSTEEPVSHRQALREGALPTLGGRSIAHLSAVCPGSQVLPPHQLRWGVSKLL